MQRIQLSNLRGMRRLISVYSLLRRALKRSRKTALQAAVFVVLVSCCEFAFPLLSMVAVDRLIPRREISLLHLLALGLLFLLALRWLCNWMSYFLCMLFRSAVLTQVQVDLVKDLKAMPLSFYSRYQTGVLVSRVMNGVMGLEPIVGEPLVNLVRIITTLLIGTALIVQLDTPMVVATAVYGVALIFARRLFRLQVAKSYSTAQQANEIATATMTESIAAHYTERIYCRERYESLKVMRSLFGLLRANSRVWRLSALRRSAEFFLGGGLTLYFMWSGSIRVMHGQLSVGQYVAISSVLASISSALYVFFSINEAIADTDGLVVILNELRRNRDASGSKRGGAVGIKKVIEGRVCLENVSFSYPGGRTVLKNLSFRINAGECIGIYGKSGSGKTTLVNLLIGMYEPTEGRILFDELDSNRSDRRFLRKQIAVVPQDIFVFAGTFRENISYSRPDATKAEIVQAARLAELHEFILSLPEGYETRLIERGENLSGGQRQRLGIARAVLAQPKLFIMDEGTSALDPQTELNVLRELRAFLSSRTSIIISHRSSAVGCADRILSLEDMQMNVSHLSSESSVLGMVL